VQLYPESPRAGGRVHALTDGYEIHFAPGRFAPGTERGDRLLAHELAHVAQRRRAGPPAPELAVELDADLAAESALRRESPRIRTSVPPGRVHAFEAWEHHELGGALGGEDRKIGLPNGLVLTYGQIVALGGDFYRSPEAIMRAPRSELEAILKVMGDEQRAVARSGARHAPTTAEANAINSAYEFATKDHSRTAGPVTTLAGDPDVAFGPHGEVSGGEHIESGAPSAQASFFDLAASNPAHFSPENISRNWIPQHQLALDLARQAWQTRHAGATPAPILPGTHASVRERTATPAMLSAPGLPATAAAAAHVASSRPDPAATSTPSGVSSAERTASPAEQNEAQAWLASAFSDHFLTDAFAAGHLISGSTGRGYCHSFYASNQAGILRACVACAIREGVPRGAAPDLVRAINRILASNASNLLLKTVHDYYNRTGVEVRNALGQQWRTFGDAHLGGSPDTIRMGVLASKASRDAVQDVLATGGTTRAQAALDYIPDQARPSGGAFESIATFSTDLAVWTPLLLRSLSPDPAVNDLYQLVKGNIGPYLGLLMRRGVRAVTQPVIRAVGTVRRRVDRTIDQAEHFIRDIPRMVRP